MIAAAPVLPAGYVVSASRIADRRMILVGYRLADVLTRLMLIRLFQQDTTYSVRAWRGLRFPVVCENSSGSSPAKRPVSSIWPPVVGLMDLSVRAVGTSMRMS